MRKLIVIVCIAAVFVAVVVVLPIEISPFVPVGMALTVRHESPRADVQLATLSASTHLRAPPA